MHESLTESLHLAGTVISVSHHGKIRVHTGIPAAVTVNTVSCVVILDIIALAGRTYEGTGSTCQTWFIQFSHTGELKRSMYSSCAHPSRERCEYGRSSTISRIAFFSSLLPLLISFCQKAFTALVRASPFL
jgi:hypothetical protein